jgi:uncharacterized phiE125 gp8 family phage protein
MRPSAAALIVATPPAIEPVSLTEAKAHLRVDGDDENAYIGALISVARERLEHETRRAFIRQQITVYMRGIGCGSAPVELPRPRVMADAIVLEYRDEDAAWQASTGFIDQRSREPALLWVTDAPSSVDSPRSPQDAVWRATYWAGYGAEPANVPSPIRHAILLLVAHLFEQRNPAVAESIKDVPKSLDWMLNPYRVPWEGAVL